MLGLAFRSIFQCASAWEKHYCIWRLRVRQLSISSLSQGSTTDKCHQKVFFACLTERHELFGSCSENTFSKLTWYRTKASFLVVTTLVGKKKKNSFKLYCWKKIQLLTPAFLSSSQPSSFQIQFFRAKMLGTDNCAVSYAVWCKEITRESDMFFLDSTADG